MNCTFTLIRNSRFGKIFSTLLCFLFVLLACPSALAYTVDTSRTDTAADFDAFLDHCSKRERVMLLQTLRALDKDVPDNLFGRVKGLKLLGNYTNDPKRAREKQNDGVPLRPKTFNEVAPDTVIDAVEKGYVDLDLSQDAIRRELIWRRYNKINYPFHSIRGIDYHRDILRWVATKKNVDENLIQNHSTYDLERAVAMKYLETIWNKLDQKQREELLRKIELNTGTEIDNKAAIAAMSGGAAVAALGATVALSGFAFYTTMSVVICTVAGWFGITLPFVVYMTTSSTVALLAGPVGWCLAAVTIGGGAIWMGLPEADTISAFVIQVNQIKTSWLSNQ